MSKIQNLKAIHNQRVLQAIRHPVVSDVKDTKFESNSQLSSNGYYRNFSCFRCQRYKIWKQFTTKFRLACKSYKLFQMSKIQNLKAIHNSVYVFVWCCADVKDTKFESNSQHYADGTSDYIVVSDVKDTKFESNSQLARSIYSRDSRCFRCQRYKIWKQFTTNVCSLYLSEKLFQMSKIQNLKAIHNNSEMDWISIVVVSDVKDTKFESNSQRRAPARCGQWRCFRCQRYKIWKQFTTCSR